MRAAILEEFGKPFVVEEIDVLPPGPGDIIVRTSAAAYCITDCVNQRGELGKQPPTVLGHSAVGTVQEVGSQVTDFRAGDRVLCGATPECRVCYWCVRGRPDQCAELFAAPGPLGTSASGLEVTTTAVGGYAEQLRIPAIWAFPLESERPDEQLSLLGCGITSGLGAVFNIAGVRPGSSVAVLGCGHLGLWMVQAARYAGAVRVIAVEPLAERRAVAGELGATDLVDPAEADPVEQVKALTAGRGADFVLEAAGRADAMEQALPMAHNTGVVVLTGVDTAATTVTFPALELAIHGRDIRQCQNGRVRMRRDVPRFLAMLDDGLGDPDRVISTRCTLDEINDVRERCYTRRELTPVIVPHGSEA
ncbi:MAG: zinc-binding dehydrogenase [Pseudonocardiaceae bacterium]|nr:zinc-binding dehydrogenase [Pseudonocardiaceae bacterium]